MAPCAGPESLGRRCAGPLLVLFALLVGGCGAREDPVIEIAGPTMGTYYAVKIPRPPAGLEADALRAGIEGVLTEVNREISTYDPDSELSRLNRDPSTDWIPISPNLHAVLAEGLRTCALTGGVFDITVGPLVNLWGFGPEVKADAVPSPEQIQAALERVGYQKLGLRAEPPAIRKGRSDLLIDLSALGEGYGADRVAAYLEAQGLGDYMVAVAGTIRVRGRNAKGQPWGIAVEAPTEGQRTVQRVIPLSEGAVSTSGDYRNFFEQGGRRYSHHIDPRTGESVTHRLASATVVMPGGSDNAMSADALATALVLMGERSGPALAESQGLAALFLVREGDRLSELATASFEHLP